MELAYAYLKLDKDWDLQKLAALSRLYTQCYSFVYSLSAYKLDSYENGQRILESFRTTYYRYAWRNGYSAVNFYDALYKQIPNDQRPIIKEIRYESPGHIKLKGAAAAAGLLAAIVFSGTKSISLLNNTYNEIQRGISEHELNNIEVERRELKLEEEKLDFILESEKRLFEFMGIPPEMLGEFRSLANYNDLKALNILMSFKRRLEPIAQMQLREEIIVEPPSNE